MKAISVFLLFCFMGSFAAIPEAFAAEASASAREVTSSTGRPSSIQVRQQFFSQQQALLLGQLQEIERCLRTSQLNVVLYDPQGNINRVPQTDLVDCGRQLQRVQRQLQSLARRAEQLNQDAQALALALERAALLEQTAQRLRAARDAAGLD
ncbi:MAG: hypothetical protein AB1733_24750 [Thermodesulfobacteriota bacterium]